MSNNKLETKLINYRSPGKNEVRRIQTKVVPDTKGKLVFDESRDFYYYHVKKKIWVKVQHGIYRVYRALSYMLLTYFLFEIPQLKKLEEKSRDIHLDYSNLTKENSQSIVGIKIKTMLCGISQTLAKVIDKDKRQAQQQVAFCVLGGLNDSHGRLNIGVLKCRTITVARKLGQRISTIQRIQPRVLFLHNKVRSLIDKLEVCNHQALNYLVKALSTVTSDPELSKQTRQIATASIDMAKEQINLTNLKPFTRTRAKLLKECDHALEALRANDRDKLVQFLSVMINSLKLKACRGSLEFAMIDLSLGIKWPALFTEEIRQRIIKLFIELTSQLSQIDETGFQHPVCQDVISHLQQATALLHMAEFLGGLTPKILIDVKKMTELAIKPI